MTNHRLHDTTSRWLKWKVSLPSVARVRKLSAAGTEARPTGMPLFWPGRASVPLL